MDFIDVQLFEMKLQFYGVSKDTTKKTDSSSVGDQTIEFFLW